MNKEGCAESLNRCFGGNWFTHFDGGELIAVKLLITESAIRVNCAVRLKVDGKVSIEINERAISRSHIFYTEIKGDMVVWERIFGIVKNLYTNYVVCEGVVNDDAHTLLDRIGRPSLTDITKHQWSSDADPVSVHLHSAECSVIVKRPRCGPTPSSCFNCRRSTAQLLKYVDKVGPVASTKYARLSIPEFVRSMEAKSAKLQNASMKLRQIEEKLKKIQEQQRRPPAVRCLEILKEDAGSASPTLPSAASVLLAQQFKSHNLPDAHAMRWDQQLIEWSILLHAKSAAAYDFIVDSGALRLPSSRTLARYISKFPSCAGVNDEILSQMVSEYFATHTQPYAKYFAMSLDEMKIRANLVYNKRKNELVGYIDSTEMMNSLANGHSVDDGQRIATDVLVVYVRSIATGYERAIAWFPVRQLCAGEIMSIVWTVKRKLEFFSIQNGSARIRIVTVTCDGLAANHLFFKLHGDRGDAFQFKAKDPLDPSNFLYFLIDISHLMKTIRNNVEKSSTLADAIKFLHFHQAILWEHVEKVFRDDVVNVWRRLPKLTHRHVYPTPSDRMKVKLATQVLSRSVSLAMMDEPEMEETANLCGLTNRFFDIMNGRHPSEARNRRNPDLAPFTSANDPRLQWLEDEFLQFFNDWEDAVNSLDLSKSEKQRRLLSRQTMTGIRITVNGFVEAVRWILSQDDAPPYLLSGVFNQDRLEIYFGHVRSAGGSNDHPDWNQFQRIAATLNYINASRLRAVRGANVTR